MRSLFESSCLRTSFLIVFCAVTELQAAGETGTNLFAGGDAERILVIGPDAPDRLETFALAELTRHVEKVAGRKPEVRTAVADLASLPERANLLLLGRTQSNAALRRLAEQGLFKPNRREQGYSLKIARRDGATKEKPWIAVLSGADPLGALYAVRDFSHYYFYRQGGDAVLHPVQVSLVPRLKMRILEESGFNLFSAENDRPEYLDRPGFNLFSRNVVFNKQYFVDWLSEWKVTHVNVLWCNHPAYEKAFTEFHRYANSRGISVLIDFVSYRPNHESPPPSISNVVQFSTAGDCARDPKVRRWYEERLKHLITRKPLVDGIMLESPYCDGIFCQCDKCKNNPYPEHKILEEMFHIIREHRPEMFIELCINRPLSSAADARKMADKFPELPGPRDWFMNCHPSREARRYWHDLGPQYGTYLRTFRSALRNKDVPKEIDFLFNDFRPSAERDIRAYEFCYRFYGGRYGSYKVKDEPKIMAKYPDRQGPFSLALVAEAAFDPFVEGEARYRKVKRIHELTIPDYPKGREFPMERFRAACLGKSQNAQQNLLTVEDAAARPAPGKLFRDQYGFSQPGYLLAGTCVDLDNDGSREIIYASRKDKRVRLLRAADGAELWSIRVPSNHESIAVHDVDGDGRFEILFAGSGPGKLYVIDAKGNILRQWDAGEYKLGNTPAIFDADGDGVLDGYLGTRGKKFVRLNMRDLSLIAQRPSWQQCACHTAAADVDGDGRWDLFAGSGDDRPAGKGTLHRLDPISLKSVWSFKTDDNASSSDAALVDIDGDGQLELLKSCDGTHATDAAHDAVFAFETDGTLLWKVDGISGMDTPNAADLDGDGEVEIVGMAFGSEIYCLDSKGQLKWRKKLRPDEKTRSTIAPILCDLDGDKELEILAITDGAFFSGGKFYNPKANGVLFALSADGKILDRFEYGSPRCWNDGSFDATLCNIDDDPYLELILSGCDHVDVVETHGFGPNTEVFEPRRSYQRLNVVPWAYEDTFFIHRGKREKVAHRADSLVLAKSARGHHQSGRYTTELLTLPPEGFFDRLAYDSQTPPGTALGVNILNATGEPVSRDVLSGASLDIHEPVRLEFVLSTDNPAATPVLDAYRLSFDRPVADAGKAP